LRGTAAAIKQQQLAQLAFALPHYSEVSECLLYITLAEGRVSKIAHRYLRGWFLIDFIPCIPVQYIVMLLDNGGEGGEEFRSFKALRLARMSKMVRLARVMRVLSKYEQLEFFQDYSVVMGLIFVVFLIAHILACLWYMIGTSDEHTHLGRPLPGWVLLEFCGDQCADDVWQANSTLCETFPSTVDCPTDKCRWDGIACNVRPLCMVGCEKESGYSLSAKYVISVRMEL
jgi:hypothetical protein